MIKEKDILELIENALQEKQLFLVDIKVSNANQIHVYIDSEQGASVKDCIDISRQIESNLDRETEDFELEVSTPGLSEPLKVPQQFKKVLEKEVEVQLTNGEKTKGILKSFSEESVSIEVTKKIKPEGKKRKIEVQEILNYKNEDIKAIKQHISFK